MKNAKQHSFGFTAVELLITLFVGAVFLAAGYQLFSVIVNDSGDTRAESTVSSTAYDYLRRYAESATNPCAPASVPLADQAITIPTIANPRVTVSITCPQSDAPTLSQVTVSISYGLGDDTKTVQSSTYVDKSTGATPNADVTDGLIGWWKLNQNANSSVGQFNGITTSNTNAAAGQNGFGANAFAFNGTNSYVSIPIDSMPKPTAAFSVTAWFKIASWTQAVVASTTEVGGWSLSIGASGSGCGTGLYANIYNGASYVGACSGPSTITANTWTFGAMVYNGATVKVYVNNNPTPGTQNVGGMTWPATATTPLCIGSEPNTTACTVGNFFNGSIDDVRIYGRELSAGDVLQLNNGGAK